MARETGKKSFLDFFKMKELNEDEFDDDLFDDEDDDEDDEDDEIYSSKTTRNKKITSKKSHGSYLAGQSQGQSGHTQGQHDSYANKQQRPVAQPQQNRVVDFNNPRPRTSGMSEVYVMVPHDTSESQTVADFLKAGKTIVLNMSGLDTILAQRIIDFVAGSTYALDGTLRAVSDNIFIAAPSSIEISGDLRELLSDSGSPNLYRY